MKNELAHGLAIGVLMILAVSGNPGLAQNAVKTLRAEEPEIRYKYDGKENSIGISAEMKDPWIRVLCGSESKNVRIRAAHDSLKFTVNANDTIRFFVDVRDSVKVAMNLTGTREIPGTLTLTDKIFHLSRLWSEIKYNFVNIDRISFNLDSAYQCTLQRVSEPLDDYAYYRELQKFAALFRDGHTEVEDNGQFYLYQDYIKALLSDYQKKIYLVSIDKTSELDSTCLGAEIIAISGKPVVQYMEEDVFPYISASTEQHLWMQGTFRLHMGTKTHPFMATIRKMNGEVSNISMKRNGEATRTRDYNSWDLLEKTDYSMVGFKWLADSIACLEVNSFYPDSVIKAMVQEKMSLIRKAKALVLDLRRNGGGSTEVAWYIQSLLTKDNCFLNYGWQTRVNNGVKKANGNWIREDEDFYKDRALEYVAPDTVFIADTVQRIKVPTVFLIGRFTFSAAEDLLVNMYELKDRPVFIGGRTGGSTGSPLVVSDFPGDGYARICTRRICFPYSKKPFVQEGIRPDIEVQKTFKNALEHRDPVLDTAVAYLKTKMEITDHRKSFRGMELTVEELKRIGVTVNDDGAFYKNQDPVTKRRFGCYFVKNGYSALVYGKPSGEEKVKYDKRFAGLPESHFNFSPVIITDPEGKKTFDTEGAPVRDLVPVVVDLSVCRNLHRTDKIMLWFRNTNQLKSLLPARYDVRDYLDLP